MRDGGVWHTLAGQPTDDTELALALGRTLATRANYDAEAVADAYLAWFNSGPFGLGPTTKRALAGAAAASGPRAAALRRAADPDSLGNGSLMRIAPIGIWARDPAQAASVAAADSGLTHPHPDCAAACAALAAAVAAAIAGADRAAMLAAARAAVTGRVASVLGLAASRQPLADDAPVLVALHNAFRHLAAGTSAADAILATVRAGGDTDTNAAIAGALLGAADGRRAFPTRWVLPVLTCRPDTGLADAGLAVAHPRPDLYWTDDLIDLAEALLLRPSRTGLETA
jgi:ADP-ribosylglycohydrolase